MPAQIQINGVVGSNESAVDLDGATAVNLTSPTTTAAHYQWEFLDWPTNSQYTQSWLVGFGVGAATITFTPDIDGTWLVKLTDTNDGATDTVVVGVKSRRTGLRIPAAGETTESSNSVFPNVGGAGTATNHRGWALTRDLGLRYLDDLVTSGSVQLCYLEDASIAAGINAGTPLALVHGASEVLFPGGAPAPYNVAVHVPKVKVAQADLHNAVVGDAYAYVGVLKAGRGPASPAAVAPSDTSYAYMKTSVPSGTFVWVTTSGVIEGQAAVAGPHLAAPATCDFTGWNYGDYVYLSGSVKGGLVRYSDTFAAGTTASDLMTPIGIVTKTGAAGSMLVLPSRYAGSEFDGAKTNMFRGIGDYSNVRVGRPSDAGAGGVAGEEDGTIELCAVAAENITAGQIVCINVSAGGALEAWVADSSTSPDVANDKKYGIFGVAVQTVTTTNLGHFTVFGEANATTVGAAAGQLLYVGSSTAGIGPSAGSATTLLRIQSTDAGTGSYMNYHALPIPLGMYDGTKLILGIVQDPGLQSVVYSTDRSVTTGPINVNTLANTRLLGVNRSNVYRPRSVQSDWANIDLPNTEADTLMMTTSIYEDTLKGSDFYDVTNQTIGGKVWTNPPAGQPNQDIVGGSITNGAWEGVNGGGAVAANKLYGTFVLNDLRYFDEQIPIAFDISGYTDSVTASSELQLKLECRINYRSGSEAGAFDFEDTAYFHTGSVANTNTAFSVEFFSHTSGGAAFYVPKYNAAGLAFKSIDVVLSRTDAIDASMMIERVTLQALYLNKNINLHQGYPPVIFEKKIPATTIIDTGTSAFNNIDFGPAPGTAAVTQASVGANMSTVGGRTVSVLSGFIPYDSRLTSATTLNINVLGKYLGTNPLNSNIDLRITYEELTAPNNYTVAIGGVGSTQSAAPSAGGPAAGEYEVLEFNTSFTPNPAASGVRYKIERVASGGAPIPIVDGGAATVETGFQISNVYVSSELVDTYGAVEGVYEDSATSAPIVAQTDNLNLQVDTDFSGFKFTSGGVATQQLFVPIKFDKRYDFRKNIYIDVYGYVTAASATPVDLNLAISNLYDHSSLSPQTASGYTRIEKVGVDISAASGGANGYIIKHSFVLNARDVWDFEPSTLVPSYTQFRDSGNAGLVLKFTRSDAAAVDYSVMNVQSYAKSSKKSSSEGIYINVSEDIQDPQYSFLNVKSAYRADSPIMDGAAEMRTILGSAHRHYFNFAINNTVIADGAVDTLGGAGVDVIARGYGLLIPFNMAIVGIYGWGDNGGTGPIPAGVELSFNVVNQGMASQAGNTGVLHFPVDTVSVANGGWKWVGNPLNFNIPSGGPPTTADNHHIPMIYLPTAYSSSGWPGGPAAYAGDAWLLRGQVLNNSGGSITLTANVTVEAIILPNYNVDD